MRQFGLTRQWAEMEVCLVCSRSSKEPSLFVTKWASGRYLGNKVHGEEQPFHQGSHRPSQDLFFVLRAKWEAVQRFWAQLRVLIYCPRIFLCAIAENVLNKEHWTFSDVSDGLNSKMSFEIRPLNLALEIIKWRVGVRGCLVLAPKIAGKEGLEFIGSCKDTQEKFL